VSIHLICTTLKILIIKINTVFYTTLTNHYKTYRVAHQIIEYCLRPIEKYLFIENSSYINIIDDNFTFMNLREKNISSEMLLSWSAPIELTERYEIFLNNVSDSSSEKQSLFYKCTLPWFGPHCRFTFDSDMDWSLISTITSHFKSRFRITEGPTMTCYMHLRCQSFLLCLDWREICDGKRDCVDGSDESSCYQLEINECNHNEYRCYNGQCIPKEFLSDV
jgi:hypothetical protein